MDETQISITIKPIYIERLVYWIIIIALAVLLILAYANDDTTSQTTTTTQQTAQPAAPEPEEEAPVVVAATCSDAIKNQDESGVDCGGVCPKCAAGTACKSNSDCISNICSNNTCVTTAPPTLSGSFAFEITNVEIKKAPTNNSKVVSLSYKATNGLTTALDSLTVHIEIKNEAKSKCLAPSDVGECDDPYKTLILNGVESGKTVTGTADVNGVYLLDTFYDFGDDYFVIAYVYDENGDKIGGKTISDDYRVNP